MYVRMCACMCVYLCMFVFVYAYVNVCMFFLSFITIKSSRAFLCFVFGIVYVSYASIEILLTSTSSINIYRVMQYLVVNVSSFFQQFPVLRKVFIFFYDNDD